jgi:hypothetical protein
MNSVTTIKEQNRRIALHRQCTEKDRKCHTGQQSRQADIPLRRTQAGLSLLCYRLVGSMSAPVILFPKTAKLGG